MFDFNEVKFKSMIREAIEEYFEEAKTGQKDRLLSEAELGEMFSMPFYKVRDWRVRENLPHRRGPKNAVFYSAEDVAEIKRRMAEKAEALTK